MSTCKGTKRNGTLCTLPAMAGSDYCFNHNPANAEYRKRSASRAATAKHSRVHQEIRDVRQLVRDMLELLVTDELNEGARRELQNIIQLLQVYCRLAELEVQTGTAAKPVFGKSPDIAPGVSAEEIAGHVEGVDAAERGKAELFRAVEKLKSGDRDGAAELAGYAVRQAED